MRIVAAIGGNALLARGERPDARTQTRRIAVAAKALARIGTEHQLVLCHGNGPQVGVLALESEVDDSLSLPYPLDVLVAETQGMIGYWLTQALRNAGLPGPVAAVLTQIRVSGTDAAFSAPTKFIGPAYPRRDAVDLAARHGWQVARDGEQWRRVVASPLPQHILELETIRTLVEGGTTVVCAGGGGVPVVADDAGLLAGVDAVVDKDLTAGLLAAELDADTLLLLTDVDAVMEDFGTPAARPLRRIGSSSTQTFPAGSMGPKVAACRRFAEETGRTASIGSLSDSEGVLAGTSGTVVTGN